MKESLLFKLQQASTIVVALSGAVLICITGKALWNVSKVQKAQAVNLYANAARQSALAEKYNTAAVKAMSELKNEI